MRWYEDNGKLCSSIGNIDIIKDESSNNKKCSECLIVKNKSKFHKNKSTKDGFTAICKNCKKEYDKKYRKKNKEKISEQRREYMKKYSKDNKEKMLEHSKKYRKKNKEKILEQYKEYYKDNKEKILEQHKEYYKDNKEVICEAKRIGIPITMMREVTEINGCGISATIELNQNI